MKLRTKIQIYTTVMIVLTLIIVNIIVFITFKNSSINNEVYQLENKAINIIKEIEKNSDNKTNREKIIVNHLLSDGSIAVIGADNKSKIQIMTKQQYKLLKQEFSEKQIEGTLHRGAHHFAYISIPIIWKDGETANLQIYENIDVKFESFETLKWILIGSTIMLTLIIFILNLIITHNILKPIHQLIHKMSNINKTKGYEKVEKLGHTSKELDDLTDAFNLMMQRLSDQEEKEQSFIANASHELKTPITIILSYSDMLKRFGKTKPDLLEEGIDAIHEESLRMKYLAHQMLQITSFQQNSKNAEVSTFNLLEVIEHTAQKLSLTHHRKINVVNKISQENVKLIKDQFIQLITIFIDNAIKYSNKEVDIHIIEAHNDIAINIIDQGIGIPEESIENIFNRFYRVDKARARKTGGSGLGLYIAKEIAQANNIGIKVESKINCGTTMTLTIKEKYIESDY
ncbi:ATP-binding protein [Macrococcus animalis]|uniref:ATP-binding protein n=1 Tax=Macrococcus animalis TaxID=3395467 RepID=UPI0039BE9037